MADGNKSKLHVTGLPFMFVVKKALALAKENGIDHDELRKKLFIAGAAHGVDVLREYFEVV